MLRLDCRTLNHYNTYIGRVLVINITHDSYGLFCNIHIFLCLNCTCYPHSTTIRDIWKKQGKYNNFLSCQIFCLQLFCFVHNCYAFFYNLDLTIHSYVVFPIQLAVYHYFTLSLTTLLVVMIISTYSFKMFISPKATNGFV